jgi:hypothetical protein
MRERTVVISAHGIVFPHGFKHEAREAKTGERLTQRAFMEKFEFMAR